MTSALVNAALNFVLHADRQAITVGSLSGRFFSAALALQPSLQAPFFPAALNLAAVHLLGVVPVTSSALSRSV